MKQWRSNRLLVRLLTVLLPLASVAASVRGLAFGRRLVVLGSPLADNFRTRAHDAESFARSTGALMGLTVLVIAPVFVAWMWRAAKNQQALGRRPERLGSGWAIGGWFVPLANLAIPVLVVQDLWRGSTVTIDRDDPRWRIADRSWLVGWWWGIVLVAALGVSGEPVDSPGVRLAVLEQRNAFALIGSVSAAVAAVLALVVVRGLSRRQEACLRVQHEAALGAPVAGTAT